MNARRIPSLLTSSLSIHRLTPYIPDDHHRVRERNMHICVYPKGFVSPHLTLQPKIGSHRGEKDLSNRHGMPLDRRQPPDDYPRARRHGLTCSRLSP